jgi:ABC-type bacteriocin/lantibiotic exporter with double-glycine peptidase domain
MLRVERQDIWTIYIFALFNGLVSLSLPLGIQAIINLIAGGKVNSSWIILVILVIAGVGIAGILQILQLTVTENLQQKIFTRSAFEFSFRIPRVRLDAVGDAYMPEIVNRFFDTLSVQKGLSKILMDFPTALIQVFLGLLLLSFYHPFFILFGLVLLIYAFFIFYFTSRKGLETSLDESNNKYEVAHWLEEVARSMYTFKSGGNDSLVMDKTDESVSSYLHARQKHFSLLRLQFFNLVGFKVFMAAALLLIGGLLVFEQQMNIGQFVASEIIIILILASVEKLIFSMETIYDVLTATEKLGAVTDIPLEREEDDLPLPDAGSGMQVDLKGLHMPSPQMNSRSLEEFELHIPKGQKLAIHGDTGSGKELLMELISGLYENYDGHLSYNDVPAQNISVLDLRRRIGTFLPKDEIFLGTILENITLGRPGVGMPEVKTVTSLLGLQDLINQWKRGYHTMLLPEGKNMSELVQLKIKLARALVGEPDLIIIGGDCSALDGDTKERLILYMRDTKASIIINTHDRKLVEGMDRLVELHDGRIVDDKTMSASNLNETNLKG